MQNKIKIVISGLFKNFAKWKGQYNIILIFILIKIIVFFNTLTVTTHIWSNDVQGLNISFKPI